MIWGKFCICDVFERAAKFRIGEVFPFDVGSKFSYFSRAGAEIFDNNKVLWHLDVGHGQIGFYVRPG